ncbi:uncharacterized protein LOC135830050 [Sycon ciliatum]|uniref:uncharacterized protein LOC135830050 n=1 Tax=Sycon ciliatum TaxID=27933 RepID=UPI0031F61714
MRQKAGTAHSSQPPTTPPFQYLDELRQPRCKDGRDQFDEYVRQGMIDSAEEGKLLHARWLDARKNQTDEADEVDYFPDRKYPIADVNRDLKEISEYGMTVEQLGKAPKYAPLLAYKARREAEISAAQEEEQAKQDQRRWQDRLTQRPDYPEHVQDCARLTQEVCDAYLENRRRHSIKHSNSEPVNQDDVNAKPMPHLFSHEEWTEIEPRMQEEAVAAAAARKASTKQQSILPPPRSPLKSSSTPLVAAAAAVVATPPAPRRYPPALPGSTAWKRLPVVVCKIPDCLFRHENQEKRKEEIQRRQEAKEEALKQLEAYAEETEAAFKQVALTDAAKVSKQEETTDTLKSPRPSAAKKKTTTALCQHGKLGTKPHARAQLPPVQPERYTYLERFEMHGKSLLRPKPAVDKRLVAELLRPFKPPWKFVLALSKKPDLYPRVKKVIEEVFVDETQTCPFGRVIRDQWLRDKLVQEQLKLQSILDLKQAMKTELKEFYPATQKEADRQRRQNDQERFDDLQFWKRIIHLRDKAYFQELSTHVDVLRNRCQQIVRDLVPPKIPDKVKARYLDIPEYVPERPSLEARHMPMVGESFDVMRARKQFKRHKWEL